VSHAKKNILIVDDMKSNRLYLSHFFEQKNFVVFTVESGHDALALMENTEVDIILLDVEMPKMDGYETCHAIKHDSRWKNIPVIFITSKHDEISTLKGFEVGAQDFIVKPFNDGELYARVKTHLELKAKSEQLLMLNKYLEEIVEQRTFQLKHTLGELENAYNEIEASHKKLQTLSFAKTNFLKIISHEIRTPLNGIVGFVDVLQDTVQTDELKTYVDFLAKSANRLEKFATDAILITELMVDSYELVKTEFLLQEIITDIEQNIEEESVQKNIKLIYEPIGSPMIYTDKSMLSIVLRHVIENAVKFSPDSTDVVIQSIEDDQYIAQIIVRDRGEGFSEKALENLFDLFALGQEHMDKNSGLGLALSFLVMEKLGGKIMVKNNKNRGASVTLYL